MGRWTSDAVVDGALSEISDRFNAVAGIVADLSSQVSGVRAWVDEATHTAQISADSISAINARIDAIEAQLATNGEATAPLSQP